MESVVCTPPNTARATIVLCPSCKATSALKVPLLWLTAIPFKVNTAFSGSTTPVTKMGDLPTVVSDAGLVI